MPFDGAGFARADEKAERRRILISALRGEMPENFVWDYSRLGIGEGGVYDRRGCAIGLARILFPEEKAFRPRLWRPFRAWGRALGISARDASEIFCSRRTYGAKHFSDVRPEQVAGELEKLEASLVEA